jgi:hypothetical protein
MATKEYHERFLHGLKVGDACLGGKNCDQEYAVNQFYACWKAAEVELINLIIKTTKGEKGMLHTKEYYEGFMAGLKVAQGIWSLDSSWEQKRECWKMAVSQTKDKIHEWELKEKAWEESEAELRWADL